MILHSCHQNPMLIYPLDMRNRARKRQPLCLAFTSQVVKPKRSVAAACSEQAIGEELDGKDVSDDGVGRGLEGVAQRGLAGHDEEEVLACREHDGAGEAAGLGDGAGSHDVVSFAAKAAADGRAWKGGRRWLGLDWERLGEGGG